MNVKIAIQSKSLRTLREIFARQLHVKTVVARDIGIGVYNMDEKLQDANKFRVVELNKFAKLCEVDLVEIMVLVANQIKEDERENRIKGK